MCSLIKDGQCCNLIGEHKSRARKVLGPRKSSNVTRPSFRAVAREGLGTRLLVPSVPAQGEGPPPRAGMPGYEARPRNVVSTVGIAL